MSAIPDVMEFIRAKRESGRLRQFNLSLLITDEFMQAVREDREWKLAFPLSRGSTSRTNPISPIREVRMARVAGARGLRGQRRGPGRLQDLQDACRRGACGT